MSNPLFSRCWPVILGLAVIQAAVHVAPPRVTDIGVANRSNAYASIATSGRFAAIAWGATSNDGATDVYLAASTDGGQSFGTPVRVNSAVEHANLSPEQPPRVALIPSIGTRPAIVVVWTSKGETGTCLFSARSDDGGRTFRPASPVPGADAAGNRGWESVVTKSDGSIVALWLDHRDLAATTGAAPMNHAEHQHVASGENKADGVARAQLSQLFVADLARNDSPHSIARGVCYCCKTAMATDMAGTIYAAWRQVYPGNVRDIAFSTSSDGGRRFAAPVRVSDDNWVLDGCPENGPAIAVDASRRIHVAWPTLMPGSTTSSSPTLGLFYARSDDGRHFTARQQIPTQGVPRHVQVAATPAGEIVAAWDEQLPGSRAITVARGTIDRNGSARFSREPIADDSPGSYPIVVTTDSAVIVGWTSGPAGQSVIRMKRLID